MTSLMKAHQFIPPVFKLIYLLTLTFLFFVTMFLNNDRSMTALFLFCMRCNP